MASLVKAGYARPGQGSRELIDSFSVDLILDFIYGCLVDGLEPKERKRFDDQLKRAELEYKIESEEEYLERRRAEIRAMQQAIGGAVRGG